MEFPEHLPRMILKPIMEQQLEDNLCLLKTKQQLEVNLSLLKTKQLQVDKTHPLRMIQQQPVDKLNLLKLTVQLEPTEIINLKVPI
jgi:hypothetical protein